jgi:hypothetical protein
MNPHIAAALAAERRCDLQEIGARQRAALSARTRHSWRKRIGGLRGLRHAGARMR